MKNSGSVLSLIAGLLVLVASVGSLMVDDLGTIWHMEFSQVPGFVIVAVVLAILITILAFLSFSTKPRLLGLIILAASFAGIVVGSTLTDIAMLFGVVGGVMLFTLPPAKTGKAANIPASKTPEPPNPS